MHQQNKKTGKYEVRQPPNFESYYKRMQEERDRELARRLENERYLNNHQGPIAYQTRAKTLATQMQNINQYQNKGVKRGMTRPGTQFEMYLSTTPNVFYEDREEIASLKKFQMFRPLVLKLFIFLFLFWLLLTFVQPYKGICPNNADCGVYVHCHAGYNLANGRCVVSDETRELAHLVCEAVVENLKYQYGSQDCQGDGDKPSPFVQLQQMIEQYSITTRAAEEEIENWLRQRKNQDKFGFSFYNREIRPRQKKFTVFCKFQKLVSTPGFYLIFSIAVVLLLFILVWIRILAQRARAQRIYESLKRQLKKKKDIVIDVEEIQREHGKIYDQLWEMVNELRKKERAIGFYEDQYLHWKLLD